MLAPSSRLLLLAAAAAAAAANAADLTTFPADYDVLAVSLEFEVELLATQAATAKNDKLGASFNAFADKFDEEIASGKLTAAQHNAALDAFFTEADAAVPSFSTTAKEAIQDAWEKYAFEFLLDLHESQWDALHYGITEAKPSAEITALLDKVDAYMAENAKAGAQEKLQEQVDTFFTEAEKLTPGFKKTVVDALKAKAGDFLPAAKDTKATTAPPVTTAPTSAPTTAPAGSAATRSTLAIAATTLVAAVATLLL